MDALWWDGVPVDVVRYQGAYCVVRFSESCEHHTRGNVVCISSCSLIMRRPVAVVQRHPLLRVPIACASRVPVML